jgi:hypothetical protein
MLLDPEVGESMSFRKVCKRVSDFMAYIPENSTLLTLQSSSCNIVPGSDSRKGNDFLFSTASTPDLGPIQPPIQCVPRAISPGVKRPGREADHSPPSSAEVKKVRAISALFHMSSWNSAYLIKRKDNFTFSPLVVTLYSLMGGCRRFRRICCFHLGKPTS